MLKKPLDAEGEIRVLIERWADAVQRQDIEAILEHHAEDIVMFDVPCHSGLGQVKPFGNGALFPAAQHAIRRAHYRPF